MVHAYSIFAKNIILILLKKLTKFLILFQEIFILILCLNLIISLEITSRAFHRVPTISCFVEFPSLSWFRNSSGIFLSIWFIKLHHFWLEHSKFYILVTNSCSSFNSRWWSPAAVLFWPWIISLVINPLLHSSYLLGKKNLHHNV